MDVIERRAFVKGAGLGALAFTVGGADAALDEEPIAILLRRTANCASMGHDPTIGGPAWAATRVGPFLTEQMNYTMLR